MASGIPTRQVTRPRTPSKSRPGQEQDDLYAMANLFPRTTGMPMTVWVSPRGRARHPAWIKVSLSPGRMDIGRTAVVGIRPSPRLIQGSLAPADFDAVSQWTRMNEEELMDFWNETIDTVEMGARLKKFHATRAAD